MNSGTFNKWLGAILFATLLMFGLNTIIMESRPEGPPAKPGFEVAEVKETAAGAAATPAAADPAIADALKKADADSGQKLTRPCQACHTFDKGGAAKVGPNLWGVVGRKVASTDGFAYSDDLKKMGGDWDYDHLYKFLANPKGMVAGTKMGFAGYPKWQDRADVIAYLRTLSDSPVPLP
jgi:cytochrome c